MDNFTDEEDNICMFKVSELGDLLIGNECVQEIIEPFSVACTNCVFKKMWINRAKALCQSSQQLQLTLQGFVTEVRTAS